MDLHNLIVPGGTATYVSYEGGDGVLLRAPSIDQDGTTLKFEFRDEIANAGKTVTVTVKVTSADYADYFITVTLTVARKGVPTVIAPSPIAGLTYNGRNQALIKNGSTSGSATMYYSLYADKNYHTGIPMGRDAGTYTIYYKVEGGENYTDVAPQSITVTIAGKAATVAPKSVAITKGDAIPDFELVCPDLVGNDALTFSQEPAFACFASDGTQVDPSTAAAGTYSITWTNMDEVSFVGADNYEITKKPTGVLTIHDPTVTPPGGGSTGGTTGGGSSSGGSSSGGSSGSSSSGGGSSSDRDSYDSNPVIKTETKNHADGSTTKTETRKDGSVTQTTTGKDGGVSKTETKKDGSSVTENKAADGSTGTVKTDKNGQTTAETTLSSKAIETAKRNGEPVTAPVQVEATRNSDTAPVVKVELPKNSGDTKVEIPVSNVKPGTVAVLVHPDGTEEIVKNSLPTEDGIQLTVDGNATVKIVDNSKGFIDTQDHWAKDAIDFVSARGLVNGMSATIYAPNNSTTRAQLWTILARQNDADLTGGATWFENAQNWAKTKGISDGANPNAAINRAQMVTMLWRAMGQPAPAATATFTDVPADAYYAGAVSWAVENGITTGVGGGKFNPNGTCTRAQIAAFLARSMK